MGRAISTRHEPSPVQHLSLLITDQNGHPLTHAIFQTLSPLSLSLSLKLPSTESHRLQKPDISVKGIKSDYPIERKVPRGREAFMSECIASGSYFHRESLIRIPMFEELNSPHVSPVAKSIPPVPKRTHRTTFLFSPICQSESPGDVVSRTGYTRYPTRLTQTHAVTRFTPDPRGPRQPTCAFGNHGKPARAGATSDGTIGTQRLGGKPSLGSIWDTKPSQQPTVTVLVVSYKIGDDIVKSQINSLSRKHACRSGWPPLKYCFLMCNFKRTGSAETTAILPLTPAPIEVFFV
ncbi:uncharacterized protein CLUP02_02084 [Colletotrichum lupini]|uniref:Uncharacterized protein n=1 Tax=Colletotrichum lupini TaxID=145971 RepID=A0A9Q8SEC1_9PEZI|nr:uncharacterized protein CLUP02_02084 [Colletotrichum lupini]UQC75430.1 hypothetical protein CLUP02_02084 [Colletotrichum lupini]